MVYVFKKINNLTGDNPAQSSDPSAVISSEDGAGPAANPHQSTYQNPSNIYNANLGENLGKLETGIGKSISDTQKNLTESSGRYKGALDNIDSGYQFNGRSDLENINDAGTFSRLNTMVTPLSEQTQLNAEKSNTRNYNPDTAGLASSSTISGLSNQLKNQYGTTAGGSRLDAQLYRGSGQAGKAINENLTQLGDFRKDKERRLGEETNLLSQYNKGAADKSAALLSQAGGYQGELKADAKGKAAAMQSQYDTGRQNAISGLNSKRDATDYKTQLQNAINSEFGDRKIVLGGDGKQWLSGDPVQYFEERGFSTAEANQLAKSAQLIKRTAPRDGMSRGGATHTVDMTDMLKSKLLTQFSGNVNLGQFDASKYVGGPKTFDEDSFIDPRYNRLSQLIGGQQIAGTPQADNSLSIDNDGFQNALNNYMSTQSSDASAAVRGLFDRNVANQERDRGNSYANIAKMTAVNPAFGQAMLGNDLFMNGSSYFDDAKGTLGGLFGGF